VKNSLIIVSVIILVLLSLFTIIAQEEDVLAGIINLPSIININNSNFVLANGTVVPVLSNVFTGDQFFFDVGIIDPNGIIDIRDVFVALINGTVNGSIQANCRRDGNYTDDITNVIQVNSTFNVTFTQFNVRGVYYNCSYVVERDVYGNSSIGICVLQSNGSFNCVNVTNRLFFNPMISLMTSNGPLVFPNGVSGQTVTSNTIRITNLADDALDLVIQMTMNDLYDPSNSGAICPTSNQFRIENIIYSAVASDGTSGGNFTLSRPPNPQDVIPNFGITPGEFIDITFYLTYPTPCIGNFNTTDALRFFARLP
jgi:hypothetical protein